MIVQPMIDEDQIWLMSQSPGLKELAYLHDSLEISPRTLFDKINREVLALGLIRALKHHLYLLFLSLSKGISRTHGEYLRNE